MDGWVWAVFAVLWGYYLVGWTGWVGLYLKWWRCKRERDGEEEGIGEGERGKGVDTKIGR